jgi:parallel beta-helix repeat protein
MSYDSDDNAYGNTFEGNTITGAEFAGVLIYGPYARDNTFTGNTITGTTMLTLWAGEAYEETQGDGVFLDDDAGTGNAFLNNNIYGNAGDGLENQLAADVTATCNWWGNASGPNNIMNPGGTGDAVLGPAAFTPWLTGSYPGGACDGYGPDNVAVDPASVRCLNAALPCDTVDMVFTRVDMTPVRACSVTFELSPELELCDPDPYVSIREGDYFAGFGTMGATYFDVIDHGSGVYTVDMAILGLPCGPTTSPGKLFTIDVRGSGGDGTGTITVTKVRVRDCDNAAVPALPGPPATITIDHTPPVAIGDLDATQWRTGNDLDGTTKITLNFTAPGDAAVVEVYRAPFGFYPEYDDLGGAVPALPGTYPPGGPWVLSTTVSADGDWDEPGDRDFYYYVAYSIDACGNKSAVSNMTDGTLNYHLGDVADLAATYIGDNDVAWLDISLLNTTYWKSSVDGGYNNICDVGPTTDRSVLARPLTDNMIQFEDLMMFAINYGQVSLLAAGQPTTLERPWLRLVFEEADGERTDVLTGRLLLKGNRESAKGVHAGLVCPDGLELLGVAEGDLMDRQSAPVFLKDRSVDGVVDIDLALLGRGQTIHGSGSIVELTFRVVGTVTELPRLSEMDLRDRNNRRLDLRAEPMGETELVSDRTPGETLPARVELSARPNPFSGGTSLRLSLPRSTSVSLRVYDVSGRLVETLVDGQLGAGHHGFKWHAAGVSPGVYLAILEVGSDRLTRKLTLLP